MNISFTDCAKAEEANEVFVFVLSCCLKQPNGICFTFFVREVQIRQPKQKVSPVSHFSLTSGSICNSAAPRTGSEMDFSSPVASFYCVFWGGTSNVLMSKCSFENSFPLTSCYFCYDMNFPPLCVCKRCYINNLTYRQHGKRSSYRRKVEGNDQEEPSPESGLTPAKNSGANQMTWLSRTLLRQTQHEQRAPPSQHEHQDHSKPKTTPSTSRRSQTSLHPFLLEALPYTQVCMIRKIPWYKILIISPSTTM